VKQVSVGNLPQDAYITRTGALPAAGIYTTQLRVQKFQTLAGSARADRAPYIGCRQIKRRGGYNDLAGHFDTNRLAEYARFVHPTLVEGSRTSFSAVLSMPRIAPGWFVTAEAGLRYGELSARQSAAGEPTAASHVPCRGRASTADWCSSGPPRSRPLAHPGRSSRALSTSMCPITTRIRSRSSIPRSPTQLSAALHGEPLLGGDLLAMRTRRPCAHHTVSAGGRPELLRGTLGQRFYFRTSGCADPGLDLKDGAKSDILASLGGRLQQRLTSTRPPQYKPYDTGSNATAIGLRYAPEPSTKRFNLPAIASSAISCARSISPTMPVAAGWYAVDATITRSSTRLRAPPAGPICPQRSVTSTLRCASHVTDAAEGTTSEQPR